MLQFTQPVAFSWTSCTRAVDISLTVQLTEGLLSAMMGATVNQGIQPDPLYTCGQYFPLSCCYPCWYIYTNAAMRRFNRTHCTCAVDIFLTVQLTEGLLSAAVDATVNQGIQPDPLYMCSRYFPLLCCCPCWYVCTDAVMWEFNRTRCMHVVDISLTVQLTKGLLSAVMGPICDD